MAAGSERVAAGSNGAGLAAAWHEFLTYISDFWFGMAMLAVWGGMTLIGVVVDQGKDAAYYTANYAPPFARLILRLHLDNIYHSPAYIAVIGAIVACMTIATFRRVIPTRMPRLHPVKIAAMPLNASVILAGDERTVAARVERFFAERGWLVRKKEFGGVEWTFADKYEWARKGVLVAHIGFVILAFGTTLYWAFGYSGQTIVVTGSTVKIPESGATLRLERFNYRIDPIQTRSGTVYQPIDYVSDVVMTGKDGVPHAQQIRVNHPVDVDGTLYYQASYGFAVPIAVTKDGKPLPGAPTAPLMEGEGFALGDTSRAIQYTRFVGTIGPGNTIAPDPRPHAPGVVLAVFDGDQDLGSLLVPLGRAVDLGDGYRVSTGPYQLYSGFQYRYDPGIPFVGLGAFVLLAGLCASFYLLPARLFVRVNAVSRETGDGPQSEVGIAATTVKGYDIYETQFADLVGALRGL